MESTGLVNSYADFNELDERITVNVKFLPKLSVILDLRLVIP